MNPTYAELLAINASEIVGDYPASLLQPKNPVSEKITVLSALAARYAYAATTAGAPASPRARTVKRIVLPKVIKDYKHHHALLDCISSIYAKDHRKLGSEGTTAKLVSENASDDTVIRQACASKLDVAIARSHDLFENHRDDLTKDRQRGAARRAKTIETVRKKVESSLRCLIDCDHYLSNACSAAASVVIFKAAMESNMPALELCATSQIVYTVEGLYMLSNQQAAA